MEVQAIHDKGQKLQYPKGKILGIVDNRHEYDVLIATLKNASFNKIETLFGEEGVHLLERLEGFFFSDLEPRVLARHIEELKAGHMIVAIDAPSERLDEVVSIATKSGVRRLVHFGPWAINWLTS